MKKEEKINEVELIRERNHGEGALTICSFCKGVYQTASFYRHVRVCAWAQNELDGTKGFENHTIQSRFRVLYCISDKILDCFVNDEDGQVIQKDAWRV